jgi:hypothetical protein
MKNIGHIIFELFLGISCIIDSFQILSNVPIIYLKYFSRSSPNFFHINIIKHLPQWKLNNGYKV